MNTMVQIRWLLFLSVVVGCTSAINIAQLLGLTGKDEPKEVPQAPEQVSSQDRQLLQQIGAMAAPLVPIVSPFLSIGANVASQIRPTVTRTLFIQVTSTHTKFPVCVTAHGVRPPCAALAAPSSEESQHHDGYSNPHDAYLVGNNQAILGYEMNNYPHLGFVGHVPQPEGHFDDAHHSEEEEWEYRDTGDIQPTAARRMPESTAMLEVARFERDLDSSLNTDEELPKSVVRPHPRYLLTPNKPLPVLPKPKTITKTLYMTKVEKITNHHVTATMVAKNCIPDHLPLCPTQTHPSIYASDIQYPAHVENPHHENTPNHHVPNQHVPNQHAHNQHTPNHHHQEPHHPSEPHFTAPVHSNQPLKPGYWNGKDAAEDKKDIVPPTADTPKEA